MKIDIEKLRNKETQKKEKKTPSDARYLNYFDLKENETMTVRLLPDGGDSGSFYVEYSTHGGNFKDKEIKTVPCANNWGQRCPICAKAYDMYKDGNKESEKWRKKTTHLSQCIVLSSPVEVPVNPNGGVVKLLNMPYNMKERAVEGILNGTVEDPFDFENGNDFIIKLTKKAGMNQYDKCYWKTKPTTVPVEFLEMLLETPLMDLSLEIPDDVDMSVLEEWILSTEATVGMGCDSHESAEEPKKTTVTDLLRKNTVTAESVETPKVATTDDTGTKPPPKKLTAKELIAELKNR